jgi:hypothetical protein
LFRVLLLFCEDGAQLSTKLALRKFGALITLIFPIRASILPPSSSTSNAARMRRQTLSTTLRLSRKSNRETGK